MALHVKVHRRRPRVYLSEHNLEDIRRRIETTHVEEWSQLVVWSRGIAKTSREYRLRGERLGERARRIAFMHAVRPEDRLVEMAIELAPALVRLAPRHAWQLSASRVEALAQLFDSFRPQLPDDLAREVAEALARAARGLFGECVKGRPILSEARSVAVAPMLAAGLSLHLDHPTAAEIIGGAVHASRDLLGVLQYYLEKDGGFPLGWAESLAHLGQVPKLALLAGSGLEQTWPRDVPWLVHYAEFLEEGIFEEGVRSGKATRDAAAPAPEAGPAGPRWPGGASTGHWRAELWRILAMVASESKAPSALRLLRRVRLPGHQDERILYENRPLPERPEGGRIPADRGRTRLYRRAGVAVFRGSGDARARMEALVRCPGALVAGGDRLQVGSFSVSLGAELLSGAARAPNGLSVAPGAGGKDGKQDTPRAREKAANVPAPFPCTRREIGRSEFHTSTVIAFEPDVGAAAEGERGALDWLRVDLTPAHRAGAASAVRTFVMMRGLAGVGPAGGRGSASRVVRPAGGGGAAFVVADEVRLATGDVDAAPAVSFTAKPRIDGNVVTVERGDARLRDFVLEPDRARMPSEEVPARPEESTAGATGEAAWRVLVRPDEPISKIADLHRLFCQVFVVEGSGADGLDAEGASQGRDISGPLCARLASEGALVLDVAGRVLVVGGGDVSRVEAVTAGEVEGVAAVGLEASAEARLEVAGEEPLGSATSAGGSAYFDLRIPARTGFVLTVEGEPSGQCYGPDRTE